jgi:ABC-type glycerol-3-phosphate transport system substrate-binding protein
MFLDRKIGITGCIVGLLMASAASADTQVVRFLTDESDPLSVKFYNQAIKDFEAANPDIRIEMEAVNTDGLLQKKLASMNAKTMPEIFKILPEELSEFARKGTIVPVDDILDQIGRDDYVPGSLIPIGGKTYNIPYTMGNSGIAWVRDDLLKAKGLATPKTWDDVKQVASKLTENGTYGFVFPAGKNRVDAQFLSQLIWSAGGTYFDKDLNVTFNNPATVQALTFLKEMAQYSPPGIGSYSAGDMINSYLTGKIGIDIYNPRVIANAASSAPDVFKNTSAAYLPVGPAGVGVVFSSANSYALASEAVGAKNLDAARKFLKYIVTGDRLKDFSLTVYPHLIPPLKSVQKDVIAAGAPTLGGRPEIASVSFDTSNSLDFLTEAGAVIKDGKITRSGVVNPYMGPIVARLIPAEVVQRVILQGEDPAEAAAWGQKQMQAVVDDLKK